MAGLLDLQEALGPDDVEAAAREVAYRFMRAYAP
jgi:hypothetical protein